MVAAFSERAPREPKYYIVKRHLLDLINTLPPGSLVPTERVLTAELGTSRTTVRQALSELVGEMPVYHIVKDKYTLGPDRLPRLFALLCDRWPEAKVNRLDGLRLDWPNRWLHVRPSNTEPIVRIVAEARTAQQAQSLCNRAATALSAG